MLNKKNIIFFTCSITLTIFIVFLLLLLTGGKRSDVCLSNYSVSKNKNAITLNISVVSSIGYVRDLKVKHIGDSKYITFYSTYGLNSKLGARDKFELDLDDSCKKIYFYIDKEYKLVLEKDAITNDWELVMHND